MAMTCIVCALHLAAAEYIPAERSKDDVLRFQHKRQTLEVLADLEKATIANAHEV